MKIVCVRFPDDLLDVLEQLRVALGVDRTSLIREAVKEFLVSLAYDHKLREELIRRSRNPEMAKRILDDLMERELHKIRKWGLIHEGMDS